MNKLLTISLLGIIMTGTLLAEDKPAKSDNSGCGTTAQQTMTPASPNDEQPASKTTQKQKQEKSKKAEKSQPQNDNWREQNAG
jgi:hypothetical protein